MGSQRVRQDGGTSSSGLPGGADGKESETWAQSLGPEDPLQSIGSQKVRRDRVTHTLIK